MGLQCSILGHSFEPDGVEREREEEGDEVITTEREIEQCRRCGAERVVSESTEVTAVVDDVEVIDDGANEADGGVGTADAAGKPDGTDDRDAADDDPEPTDGDDAVVLESGTSSATEGGADPEPDPEPELGPDLEGAEDAADDGARDPGDEDAEILTEDGRSERETGEWPREDETEADPDGDEPVVETDAAVESPGEESLSGITVPDGDIVCPDCAFRIDAHSGYRNGDPCPECNAWLETERNQ